MGSQRSLAEPPKLHRDGVNLSGRQVKRHCPRTLHRWKCLQHLIAVWPASTMLNVPSAFESDRAESGGSKKTAQCRGGKKNITGDSLSHI